MCRVFTHEHCRSRSRTLQHIRTFIALLSVCFGVNQHGSFMDGDSDEVFPAEDHLFKDSFSADKTFKFFGQELMIKEVFGGNLGVAASVWDAVSFDHSHQRVKGQSKNSHIFILLVINNNKLGRIFERHDVTTPRSLSQISPKRFFFLF